MPCCMSRWDGTRRPGSTPELRTYQREHPATRNLAWLESVGDSIGAGDKGVASSIYRRASATSNTFRASHNLDHHAARGAHQETGSRLAGRQRGGVGTGRG